MKKRQLLLVAFFLCTVCGCKAQPHPMVGEDKDAHGCIASAGYQWCGKEKQCLRSWELSAQKGFNNSQEDFIRHCY